MPDYFNNSSNDYINPSLPVCPGIPDGESGLFKFIPKRTLGVISGSNIMAQIDFTDFSQSVTAWTKERKTLQSGEVFFIQGLTKGLSYETFVFPVADSIDISSNDTGYYTHVDMSIGYYSSFKYTVSDISVNGDASLGIDIDNAINIAFGTLNISVDATSLLSPDVSGYFTFVGSTAGYDFEIPNISFRMYDGSIHSLTSDPSEYILPAKYPNTAMLGYTLKLIYPDAADVAADRWIYTKHIPTSLTYYEVSTGTGPSAAYKQYIKNVDAGNNVSTDEIMSSGDYLNYVDVNGYWDKVGQMKVWLTGEDPETNSATTNLLTGFYVYNPHEFPVILEYMTMI